MNNIELDNIIADQETGAGLLKRVHTFLGRFVRFPSDEAHIAVALWVLHAHLVEKCESTPRLAFLSAEPASGKTRALEVLELLVPRPILPVNASPAYLFTCVADGVLFDEIDTVFGPKAKQPRLGRALSREDRSADRRERLRLLLGLGQMVRRDVDPAERSGHAHHLRPDGGAA